MVLYPPFSSLETRCADNAGNAGHKLAFPSRQPGLQLQDPVPYFPPKSPFTPTHTPSDILSLCFLPRKDELSQILRIHDFLKRLERQQSLSKGGQPQMAGFPAWATGHHRVSFKCRRDSVLPEGRPVGGQSDFQWRVHVLSNSRQPLSSRLLLPGFKPRLV